MVRVSRPLTSLKSTQRKALCVTTTTFCSGLVLSHRRNSTPRFTNSTLVSLCQEETTTKQLEYSEPCHIDSANHSLPRYIPCTSPVIGSPQLVLFILHQTKINLFQVRSRSDSLIRRDHTEVSRVDDTGTHIWVLLLGH